MASGDTLGWFYPQSNNPPATNYATRDTRNGHPILNFDGATDEEAVFAVPLIRRYGGGGLTINLWVGCASATSGTMRWQVDIERSGIADGSGQDIDSDGFTGSFESNGVSAPGTSGKFIVCAIAITDGAQMDSVAVGEPMRIKVRRDADGTSGTDDIASDCQLLWGEIKET